jgi:hypothetical protein
MAATIRLKGLPPYDGDYPMPEDFDLGELYFIEREVGVRAGEVRDAVAAGSVGVLACVVAIALKRAGKGDVDMRLLWAAKDENIDVENAPEPEADARPPALVSKPGDPSLLEEPTTDA